LDPHHEVLLLLERARLVDTANKWAKGTLKAYQSKYNIITNFVSGFGVPVLPTTQLDHPPNGPSIRLMWAQERYSLYPADWCRKQGLKEETIKFGTICGILSAASHFWTLNLLQTQPDKFTFGFKDCPLIVEACSPTGQAAYIYFTEGMRRRLGDHPRPSTVLTGKHMKWIEEYYGRLYASTTTRVKRVEIDKAAVTHLLSYLKWLRAMETFGITWDDLEVILPAEGPSVGLPLGIGVILATLLYQTKSNQFSRADLAIAYTTASGLSLGTWIEHLRADLPPEGLLGSAFVLATAKGAAWTSHYYRHTYLYPALAACRAGGDSFLRTFNDTPGNTIPARFWSFNTQRRSGRSEVSKKRVWTIRAATNGEVIEHGRWRISRSSHDMPLAYLE
jgi:hypothetical protein